MENDVNLIDYWHILKKWKKTIIAMVFLITLSAVVIVLLLPKIYRGQATIMPMGGSRSISNLSGGQPELLGMLSNLSGASTPTIQILAVLKSRTLAEKMIQKYDLMKVLYSDIWDEDTKKWKVKADKVPFMEDAVKQLFLQVRFADSKKEQLVLINSEFKDPQVAAAVANHYIEELGNFIRENTFTAAKRNRIFLEGQLERNKTELLESGKELNAFYSKNKISNVVPTVDVDISVVNAPVMTEELQQKLADTQAKINQAKVVKDVPQQVYLQYLTLRRDLLVRVNSLLTQQYELAKAEEAKEDLNFQVIDWAKAPIRKYKPKRTQIVLVAFFLSLVFSFVVAFVREYFDNLKIPNKSARRASDF